MQAQTFTERIGRNSALDSPAAPSWVWLNFAQVSIRDVMLVARLISDMPHATFFTNDDSQAVGDLHVCVASVGFVLDPRQLDTYAYLERMSVRNTAIFS